MKLEKLAHFQSELTFLVKQSLGHRKLDSLFNSLLRLTTRKLQTFAYCPLLKGIHQSSVVSLKNSQ